MNAERPLIEWARRVQTTCSGPQHLREKLQATLEPMIRCALRSGLGQPPLVRWVQHALPTVLEKSTDQPDLSRLAAPLARELCDCLLARLDPMPVRETVVGP